MENLRRLVGLYYDDVKLSSKQERNRRRFYFAAVKDLFSKAIETEVSCYCLGNGDLADIDKAKEALKILEM